MSLYIKESKKVYDVIVVGSGVTGGWAAKEFCERGLKTLMVERGRKVEHRIDYPGEGKAPWELPNRGKVDNLLVKKQHQVQQGCYAFNSATAHFFGNDQELPYTTEPGTRFSWIRANQMGGESLLWARQSYRFSDHDFAANSLDGHGNDWPIRHKDLAPWYSHVEIHAGISGSKENLEQLPDSEFLPPFEMTTPEKDIKKKIEENFPDRKMIMGRTAHLSEPAKRHTEQGRVKCQARNECQKGCSFGAYFSTQSSTLPAAVKTDNLEIAPNSVVQSLIYDEKTNRIRGIRVIDNDDLSEREYFAKVVFLCASTISSTHILLNSKSKRFTNGMANSSGVLGHYLMDHNFNATAGGSIEGYEDEYYSGRRPTGIYVPNFYYKPDTKRPFLRGYALGGRAGRGGWQSQQHQDGIGAKFKQSLHGAGQWHFGFHAMGEMLPRYENQISLHPTLKDKWGLPQLHINCRYSENESAMMDNAVEEMEKMLKVAGLKNIRSSSSNRDPGLGIHEVGTARMGKDPKESVLNGYNQSHDVPNLFVTDGSSFCSTATQNPSLTFMALTVRAVDFAAKEMKAKRI